MALDEPTDKDTIVNENDINIAVDGKIKYYIETGPPLTIDFRETSYGSGFLIRGGSSC